MVIAGATRWSARSAASPFLGEASARACLTHRHKTGICLRADPLCVPPTPRTSPRPARTAPLRRGAASSSPTRRTHHAGILAGPECPARRGRRCDSDASRGLGVRPPTAQSARRRRQQRSAPLGIRRAVAPAWRVLFLSTACNASQARALIGATTSRLAGVCQVQDRSVDTVWVLCFSASAPSQLNSTWPALRACRAGVNVTKSRIVA